MIFKSGKYKAPQMQGFIYQILYSIDTPNQGVCVYVAIMQLGSAAPPITT